MSKKIIWGIVGIIVLVGVFYGGMVYGKSQAPIAGASASTFPAGARGARGTGIFGGAGGGVTIGQIISKDATSITIELATMGNAAATTPIGSKIVLLDNSTKITKLVSGTTADLAVGTEVTVTGTTDTSSGSISAQSIQIRPANTTKNTTP